MDRPVGGVVMDSDSRRGGTRCGHDGATRRIGKRRGDGCVRRHPAGRLEACQTSQQGPRGRRTRRTGAAPENRRGHRWHREIDYMHSTFDLLSHDAFAVRGVRCTVWNEKFTHWLPVYLSEAHFDRAIEAGVVQRSLARLCPYAVDAEGRKLSHPDSERCRSSSGNWRSGKPQRAPAAERDRRLNSGGTFHPGVILHVMPKLLNTAVVLLSDRGVHASDHVVEGYCLLHRLFVALLHRYPSLQRTVVVL